MFWSFLLHLVAFKSVCTDVQLYESQIKEMMLFVYSSILNMGKHA